MSCLHVRSTGCNPCVIRAGWSSVLQSHSPRDGYLTALSYCFLPCWRMYFKIIHTFKGGFVFWFVLFFFSPSLLNYVFELQCNVSCMKLTYWYRSAEESVCNDDQTRHPSEFFFVLWNNKYGGIFFYNWEHSTAEGMNFCGGRRMVKDTKLLQYARLKEMSVPTLRVTSVDNPFA